MASCLYECEENNNRQRVLPRHLIHCRGGCHDRPAPEGGSFFPSRRRHTRSKRDWSSDVCSSDLKLPTRKSVVVFSPHPDDDVISMGGLLRSEERRVGKECRSRGSPHHKKKKE